MNVIMHSRYFKFYVFEFICLQHTFEITITGYFSVIFVLLIFSLLKMKIMLFLSLFLFYSTRKYEGSFMFLKCMKGCGGILIYNMTKSLDNKCIQGTLNMLCLWDINTYKQYIICKKEQLKNTDQHNQQSSYYLRNSDGHRT